VFKKEMNTFRAILKEIEGLENPNERSVDKQIINDLFDST
jgi:hypothetical protein